MIAATQQLPHPQGTILPVLTWPGTRATRPHAGPLARAPSVLPPPPMTLSPTKLPNPGPLAPLAKPRQFVIQGVTRDGRAFRPSDWSERLAGAMSSFRPGGGVGGISAYIGYSPYCFPRAIDGVKCVIVDEALKGVEPMAWDFVMNFARDNGLPVAEICLLPDAPG
jgi:hypothetical protein